MKRLGPVKEQILLLATGTIITATGFVLDQKTTQDKFAPFKKPPYEQILSLERTIHEQYRKEKREYLFRQYDPLAGEFAPSQELTNTINDLEKIALSNGLTSTQADSIYHWVLGQGDNFGYLLLGFAGMPFFALGLLWRWKKPGEIYALHENIFYDPTPLHKEKGD